MSLSTLLGPEIACFASSAIGTERFLLQDGVSPEVYFPAVAIAACIILFGFILVYILRTGSMVRQPKQTTNAEKFSDFFNRSEVGIGVIDEEGFIVLSNKSLHDLSGYSATQLTTIGFRSLFADREDYVEPSKVAGMLDRFGESHQVFLRHRSGTLNRVRFLVLPAPYAIRENAEVLLIEAASAEGGGSGDEIGKSDTLQEAKDSFLASLNHDLKTPLTVMLGNAWLLSQEKSYSPELAEAILDSGQRLLNHLDSLLILASDTSTSGQIGSYQFDLKSLVDSSANDYKRRLQSKNIDFDSSRVREVRASFDNVVFSRLVSLMFDFSIDALPGGDLQVGLEKSHDAILFSVQGKVQLSSDVGIHASQDDSRLVIANQLVQRMAGTLYYNSLGSGIFELTVTIPHRESSLTALERSTGKAA